MSWDWYTKKDTNYHVRTALIRKIKDRIDSTFEVNSPVLFSPPIAFSYSGGKISMISIERYRYMSQFKREFTTIRILLDNGEYIPLAKLRTKHLLKISQIFLN